MKIKASISAKDYVNCMGFTNYGIYRPMTICAFLFGITFTALSFYLYFGHENIFINSFVLLMVLFACNQLRMKIWMTGFAKKAECNNVGSCSYELDESTLNFDGSQYRCQIPYGKIKDIKQSNGTHYLKFGNYSGFIIPEKIDEGDIIQFIKTLELKIKSAQQSDASETMT